MISFKKTMIITTLSLLVLSLFQQPLLYAQDATTEMRTGVDAFVSKYDGKLSQYQKDKIVKILETGIPKAMGAKKTLLIYLLKQIKTIAVIVEPKDGEELGKTGIKKQSYSTMIQSYCKKPEITPISIQDPRNMTRDQVVEYAKQLTKDKDIQRLSLLNVRLINPAKEKKETTPIKEVIGFSKDDSYTYIFTAREALKKASQENFAEIYF